jgi:hypothetical protein
LLTSAWPCMGGRPTSEQYPCASAPSLYSTAQHLTCRHEQYGLQQCRNACQLPVPVATRHQLHQAALPAACPGRLNLVWGECQAVWALQPVGPVMPPWHLQPAEQLLQRTKHAGAPAAPIAGPNSTGSSRVSSVVISHSSWSNILTAAHVQLDTSRESLAAGFRATIQYQR